MVAGEDWHAGVVGIVASRLVERHHRPVVVIALDADGNGRGSGRSIPGFDLLEGLRACDAHLSRYGGHRAAAGLEIEAANVAGFRAAFAEHCAAVLDDRSAGRTEVVDAVVGGESLGHDVAEQLARLGPFGKGNPGVRLLVPAASLSDIRPMGEGDRHARFTITSGSSRALGVAFGVNGSLVTASGKGPIDVSLELELNEWNGAVEPRVVLGEVYPCGAGESDGGGDPGLLGEQEFWRRFELELEHPLGDSAPAPAGGPRRELLERRRGSAIAAIAALASSGETVLALCADAVRRRELVEGAARPARFGGGELAIVSARLADSAVAAAEGRVIAAGAGVVLADWAALARNPRLASSYRHVVVIDPPPFARARSADRGRRGLSAPARRQRRARVRASRARRRMAVAELARRPLPGARGRELRRTRPDRCPRAALRRRPRPSALARGRRSLGARAGRARAPALGRIWSQSGARGRILVWHGSGAVKGICRLPRSLRERVGDT